MEGNPEDVASTPLTVVPPYIPSYTKKEKIEVDSHSKRALAFGIVSMILMSVSLEITIELFSKYEEYAYTSELYYSRESLIFAIIAVSTIINVAGLVFGIVGATQVRKASAPTTTKKAGTILSILGIIVNSITLVLIAMVGPIIASGL